MLVSAPRMPVPHPSGPRSPLARPAARLLSRAGALSWRSGIVARSLACFLTLLTSPALVGQEEDETSLSPEAFAEIYLDRYFAPDEPLKLTGSGQRRAEALAHYSIGLSLEARQDAPGAIAAFQRVLEIAPGEISLSRKVAYLLAQTGDKEGGLAVLKRTHQVHSGSPRASITLSEYLATFFGDDEKSRAEALRLANEAADHYPWHPAAWEHLVRMHLVARQIDEARATVERALKRDEKSPLFYLRLGRVAQRIWPLNPEEKAPEIIDGIFEKALDRGGENAFIRENVADYYHESQQSERALEIYEALIDDFPDRLELREKLARVYGSLGREEDVIATFESIVEINPQDAETHRELGRLHIGSQNYEKAAHHFREAMRLTSGTAEEYALIGELIIFQAKLAEEAVGFLERGAYLHPEDARIPFLITFALVQLERYAEALPWFEKTVELAGQSQPDLLDAVFYYRFAAAVERAGDINRAADLFRNSMELLAKLDNDDERTQSLRAEVYNYLGYMWLENDLNIDEAGELIKEALSLSPDSGAITDSLGWFYFKKGQYQEAKRELLKAEQMVTEPDGVIYDHLGQTLHQMGDHEGAVGYLRKAVELEPDNAEFKTRLEAYEKAATESQPKPETPPAPAPAEPKKAA